MNVLLFAGVRDKAGCDAIELAVEFPAAAEDILAALVARVPEAAELIRVSRLAVADRYVGPNELVDDPVAEIALIPPVSGG